MTSSELATPVAILATMHLEPGADEAWCVEYAQSRLSLFDPKGRAWTEHGQLKLQARRSDLTDEQLHYWATALAERLHGAGVVADTEVDLQIDHQV